MGGWSPVFLARKVNRFGGARRSSRLFFHARAVINARTIAPSQRDKRIDTVAVANYVCRLHTARPITASIEGTETF